MDLKALLLIQGVIVATRLSTFVTACQLAPDPSPSSCLHHHHRHPCVRERWRQSCGGAALAFFSLMADASPAVKTFASLIGQRSLRMRLAYLLLIVPVTPFSGISGILPNMFIPSNFTKSLDGQLILP
jgi:hypothetical protein